MSNHPVFKAYLAVVCFIPLLILGTVFLGMTQRFDPMRPLGFPIELLLFIVVFQLIGVLVLMIDLYVSDASDHRKGMWMFLLFAATAIAAPLYWVMVILPRGAGAPSRGRPTRRQPEQSSKTEPVQSSKTRRPRVRRTVDWRTPLDT